MVRERGEKIGERNGLPIYAPLPKQRKPLERKTPLGSREPRPRIAAKSKALRASERIFEASKPVVAERSRGVCERCLCAEAVQYHHRTPRGAGGSAHRPDINMPANLLHLCLTCHSLAESRREEAYVLGLLVHRSQRSADVPVTVGLHPFVRQFLLDDDGGKTVVEEAA